MMPALFYGDLFLLILVLYNSGTFDVQRISVTSTDNGRICLAVDYVPGHEIPAQCFIMLTCSTPSCSTQINYTITGSSGCIESIPPNTYTLSATDGDAVDSIQMPALVVPVTVLMNFITSHNDQFMTATPTLGECRTLCCCACMFIVFPVIAQLQS